MKRINILSLFAGAFALSISGIVLRQRAAARFSHDNGNAGNCRKPGTRISGACCSGSRTCRRANTAARDRHAIAGACDHRHPSDAQRRLRTTAEIFSPPMAT